jgi:uncharacterized protein
MPHTRRSIVKTAAAVSLIGFSLEPSASASEEADATVANKDRVERALNGWRDGTGSITDLFSSNIRWTIVGNALVSGTVVGKQDLVEKILKPFGARFSASMDRFRPVAIKGLYADGDMVVALFDGGGTANDGKPYANTYAWFLTLRDGLVVDATAFFDSVAFNDLWRRVTPAP